MSHIKDDSRQFWASRVPHGRLNPKVGGVVAERCEIAPGGPPRGLQRIIQKRGDSVAIQ
jgi:hypothetical protein